MSQQIDPVFRYCAGQRGVRRRVEIVIDEAYGENRVHAQVLKGMFLGLRNELSPDILDAFRNSGSIHILAVSGLHVGLIATVCFFGFSLLRLPRKATDLLTIAAVILYACLVGFRPIRFPCIADGGYPS